MITNFDQVYCKEKRSILLAFFLEIHIKETKSTKSNTLISPMSTYTYECRLTRNNKRNNAAVKTQKIKNKNKPI